MQTETYSESIGVDLGGTNIRAARINPQGEILERISAQVPPGKEAQLNLLYDCVDRLRNAHTVGIGMGVAGRVVVSTGYMLTAGFLAVKDIPLGEMMRQHTGLPVLVDNDANMAAAAEIKVGAAAGVKNVVMFTIGTGIGGSVVIDGQIYYGSGIAGQLGHLTVNVNGALCKCGRHGCVETTSSGTALRGLITAEGLPASVRAEDLFAMRDSGDARAERILLDWATPLKLAIDSMVAAVAPDVVLLGGGLGEAACKALDLVTGSDSPWFSCPVRPGSLGDHAGIIGAGLRMFA